MKNIIFISSLLYVFVMYGFNPGSIKVSNSLNKQQSRGGFMAIIHKTMNQMESMKMTGDPDFDFASMIFVHHKGGIEMLKEEIKYGSDSTLVQLARKMLESQQMDQKELERFTSGRTPGKTNADFMNEMKSHMQIAKDEMNRNMSMSGNVDKDFASLMSMHHDHGINMVKSEIKYGKDIQMKRLAQKMLTEQEKEKDQLDRKK